MKEREEQGKGSFIRLSAEAECKFDCQARR